MLAMLTYAVPDWNMVELFHALYQAPKYHLLFEVLLILLIIRLVTKKSYKPSRSELTDEEKEELIQEWTPEPLVPETDPDNPALKAFTDNVVSGKMGKRIVLNGVECINLATLNFLNMVECEEVQEASLKSLYKYGVGSCGPRGFYGTVDVHLTLEEQYAKFMECEEAALYAYGFATIASAIPAYSKRTDVIFADEACCFAIQKGLQASRSKIKFFKHNDMDDLERLLKEQKKLEQKDPKKASATRKFMVAEGLYMNYGDICPLPKLIELKYKYKVRLFLEESVSFGTLGATGKGVAEHFGVNRSDIDLTTASLEYAIGSYGGVSVGSSFVVDHQRLSGIGYCFSAALPPVQAVAAITALDKLKEEPDRVVRLEEKSRYVQERLESIAVIRLDGVAISPVKHIRLLHPSENRAADLATLQQVVDHAREMKVALTVARYLEKDELHLPQPSIRVCINCDLTTEELREACDVITDACTTVLRSQCTG